MSRSEGFVDPDGVVSIVHARGFVARLVGMDAADDVINDCWIRLRERGTGAVTLSRAFILRVLHNRAMDWHREKRKFEKATELQLEQVESPLDGTDEAKQLSAASKAVQELPPESRKVVIMRFWENLSLQAIGEKLHVTHPTVASRLKKALELLRTKLCQDLPGEKNGTAARRPI